MTPPSGVTSRPNPLSHDPNPLCHEAFDDQAFWGDERP